MAFVIDASLVLANLLPDESSEIAIAWLTRTLAEPAQAPNLLILEVSNACSMAVKRKRLSKSEAKDCQQVFSQLRIEFDFTSPSRIDEIVSLSSQFDLTIYDATYLELAKRFSIPLGTLDKKLSAAAQKLGLGIV